MSLSKEATDALLKIIGFIHPEYSGLIGFLTDHEDQLVAAGPVLEEAAKEGPGALAAAEKAAPDLAKAINDFVAASPLSHTSPMVAKVHAENITRQIVGVNSMTPAEEQAWIDHATPNPNIG